MYFLRNLGLEEEDPCELCGALQVKIVNYDYEISNRHSKIEIDPPIAFPEVVTRGNYQPHNKIVINNATPENGLLREHIHPHPGLFEFPLGPPVEQNKFENQISKKAKCGPEEIGHPY